MADLRVLASARQSPDCLRDAVLRNSAHLKAIRPAVGPNQSRAWHFRQRGKARRSVRRSRPFIRRPLPRRPSPIRVALRCRFRRPLRFRRSLLAGLAPWRVRREPVPPHSLRSLLSPPPRLPACAARRVDVRGPPRRAKSRTAKWKMTNYE